MAKAIDNMDIVLTFFDNVATKSKVTVLSKCKLCPPDTSPIIRKRSRTSACISHLLAQHPNEIRHISKGTIIIHF